MLYYLQLSPSTTPLFEKAKGFPILMNANVLFLEEVAGYLGVASLVASAVSQTAICEEPDNENSNETNGP